MAQIDNGPVTNTAEFYFGGTAAVEVHVPVAPSASLEPVDAPIIATQGSTSAASAPVNKTQQGLFGTIHLVVPA